MVSRGSDFIWKSVDSDSDFIWKSVDCDSGFISKSVECGSDLIWKSGKFGSVLTLEFKTSSGIWRMSSPISSGGSQLGFANPEKEKHFSQLPLLRKLKKNYDIV